ncbi:MurR/RpiR family transcriptional regulator [Roseibium denhamense]|uniref:Transcriptional regulator, RpiR family n=1 Tax=Roseibium denhamense TaxID=76305 RepID=A0ABY1NI43_9HYPH|nr:MurR/RpiR family transcriptional regulator [Roseibium denhamense]MTI05072.1 MurR/RpiR family transcriptional regulator [Roseibium denhamense]SMP10227.1 transcriptional regulator, RpiR family [Roseibium denhamense]
MNDGLPKSSNGTTPLTVAAFFKQLGTRADRLPKRLKQCADFIAANPDRVAVSTVAELAEAAGLQPSAVMRFCKEMGFEGFSQMQKLFRSDYAQNWPDYPTRLAQLRDHGTDSPSALLAEFVDVGRASLENLLATIEPVSLQQAVDVLVRADTIHMVGFRRAFPVTAYLAYAFEKMSVPAMLHSGVANINMQPLIRPKDAVIAITFSPYTQMTLDIASEARKAGASLVAITDVVTSPLAKLKATHLLVSELDVGAFRSLSASLSLSIALAVAVGTQRNKAQGTHDG